MQVIFESQKELADYVSEKSLGRIETPEQCQELMRAMLLKHGYKAVERALDLAVVEMNVQSIPLDKKRRLKNGQNKNKKD